MIDVKQFVYTKLTGESSITAIVWDNIYGGVAPKSTTFPCVIFNRISPGIRSNDLGIRIDTMQVSAWTKNNTDSEDLMYLIVNLFNRLKEGDIKYVWVDRVDDTFDRETNTHGVHTTIRLKMLDTNF